MNEFQKARLKLTLWYLVIIAVLLAISSLAAIDAEKRAFARIEQALSDRIQRPKLTALLEQRLGEFEGRFIKRLIALDLVLFAIGALGSYFLSGKTLKPIQNMLVEQEEFAGDASHELRTPLTTINMEIEALKRTKKVPQPYLEAFQNVQDEVKRMTAIVEGLLTFVRGKMIKSLELTHLELTSLVNQTLKEMRRIALAKQITLDQSYAEKVFVRGDTDRLKQALIILIENAINYSPPVTTVLIQLSSDINRVYIRVQDEGYGITKKDLPHIFDRFYRGRYQGTTKGAGLGLSIARQIIESHGGQIQVVSEVGKGSVFTVFLPRHAETSGISRK